VNRSAVRIRTTPRKLTSRGGAFDPMRRAILVYGGGSYTEGQRDTWSCTGAEWRLLPPPGALSQGGEGRSLVRKRLKAAKP